MPEFHNNVQKAEIWGSEVGSDANGMVVSSGPWNVVYEGMRTICSPEYYLGGSAATTRVVWESVDA
jgi:hypothetical protein